MNTILEMQSVNAGYANGPDILKGVNLILKEKEIKCIIGPNGAGKSTVLKAIAGILIPRNGIIKFNNENITGLEAVSYTHLTLPTKA